MLTPEQGQVLIQLVRDTLMERLGCKKPAIESEPVNARLNDPVLQVVRGAFVTLTIDGRLRGCIGTLEAREPLVDCVRANALHAAIHDPRFPPLTAKELARVHIEVSVLTESRRMEYKNSVDLIAKLRPYVDGVTLRKGSASATFLPQVWAQLPKVEAFLSQLCLKAGWSAEFWRHTDLVVETYQVQSFEGSC